MVGNKRGHRRDIFRSLDPGSRISVPAVNEDAVNRITGADNLLIPKNRSCFYEVGGKAAGKGAGSLAINQRKVFFSLLDPTCDSACLIAFGGGNPALYLLVHVIFSYRGFATHLAKPKGSSMPKRMFIFCTAWPLAPLSKLSIAPRAITRFVRGSTFHP